MAKKKESGPTTRHLQTQANGKDTRPDSLGSAPGEQLAQKLGEVKEMTIETEKLVYTVNEVSKLLKCSRNLTYRLCRERKIPGVIFLGSRRMVVSAAAIHRLLEGNGKPEES